MRQASKHELMLALQERYWAASRAERSQIKTDTPWDEQESGFCKIDLVAHCGQKVAGRYAFTLDVTDIATGWTECVAVANKDQESVRAALEAAGSPSPSKRSIRTMALNSVTAIS